MQIAKKIITIAALLGVAIQAAPAARLAKRDTSINVVAGGVLFAQTEQALVSECGGSSFEGVTSGGSPTVGDCLQIARNIAGGGSWSTIADGNWRQLVQSGTCAFGVRGTTNRYYFIVGNQDIIDLINDSVNRFQWNGLVGSRGDMQCRVVGSGQDAVSWGLYHT